MTKEFPTSMRFIQQRNSMNPPPCRIKHKVNHTKADHNQTVENRWLKRMSEEQPEKKDITYKGT